MSDGAIKLERLRIDHGANETQMDGEGGWLVCKSRGAVPMTSGDIILDNIRRAQNRTPAASPPSARESGSTLQFVRGEDGTSAWTTADCTHVKIMRPGFSVEVAKADLEEAERDAIVPSLGFAPQAEIAKRVEDVIAKARILHRDEKTGRFVGRFFQRAQSRPKIAGTKFFG